MGRTSHGEALLWVRGCNLSLFFSEFFYVDTSGLYVDKPVASMLTDFSVDEAYIYLLTNKFRKQISHVFDNLKNKLGREVTRFIPSVVKVSYVYRKSWTLFFWMFFEIVQILRMLCFVCIPSSPMVGSESYGACPYNIWIIIRSKPNENNCKSHWNEADLEKMNTHDLYDPFQSMFITWVLAMLVP